MALSRLKRDTIITNPYRVWLSNHGDAPIAPEIAERVFKTVTVTKRYRPGTFSASSAGMCLRRQVLGYLNTPLPDVGKTTPDLQQIYTNGTYTHMRWQAGLLSAGLLDDIEVVCSDATRHAYGSMDGVGTTPDTNKREDWRGKRYGFELKSMNSYGYDQAVKLDKIKDDHLAQIHRYFLLTGMELFIYIIENKDTNRWHEWVVEPDMEMLESSRRELASLNDALRVEELPAVRQSCAAKIGPAYRGCPYASVCSEVGFIDNIDYKRLVF